jgi:hypothetical protein
MEELFNVLQGTDNAPTAQATRAVSEVRAELERQLTKWKAVKTTKLPAVNRQLKEANLPELVLQGAPLKETADVGKSVRKHHSDLLWTSVAGRGTQFRN